MVSQALEAGSVTVSPPTSRPSMTEAGSSTSALDSAEMYFVHKENKLKKQLQKVAGRLSLKEISGADALVLQ